MNPTHYSNEEESINFIKNIIVPYVEEQRSLLELPNQNALVLLDVFTGQTTPAVLKTFKDNEILLVFVPANMTHIFQPLDLSVNAFAKKFTKDKLINGTPIKLLDKWTRVKMYKKSSLNCVYRF